ncbi:hypothetical protein BIV57_07985 [Mangrovactinospora gilvigrisea]|uniref:Uncharacterized protein n=1 Tax=Mangrovactinospora gilvigrisea TaxID=1428644 RepID=A0A1J7BH69_9ACTN|nr:hypothetical protein [Mangrovactinospora gilvigrisea]OIV38006.1 hypothetical protein BIV57_07985 [Mangrovactinospora gilvigrisea]
MVQRFEGSHGAPGILSVLEVARPDGEAPAAMRRRRAAGWLMVLAAVPLVALSVIYQVGYGWVPGVIGAALITIHGLALLVDIDFLQRFVEWLSGRIAYVVPLTLIGALIWLAISNDRPSQRALMGNFIIIAAFIARFLSPHFEPIGAFDGVSAVRWRILRAITIHCLFISGFSFGSLIMLTSMVRQEPIAIPISITIATAAFIFKAHSRTRKVCTLVAQRAYQVRLLIEDIPASNPVVPADRRAALTAVESLDSALATCLQTGFRCWGTTLLPSDQRTRIIAWHRMRVCFPPVASAFNNGEAAALDMLIGACDRWTDASC